ncbi:MAG TPA: YfhO family protein [Syntrophorhabdales bacterium]|nr:YfhO family protein [Syntrophorhabdales bacterium]
MIFMLSGYLMSVHNLLPHLFAVSWFPLVLLFFLKHFETGRLRDGVFVAFFLLMQFLSGAPEILMMSVLALIIVAFFLPSLIGEHVGFYGRIRSFVVIFSLFLLLSAVQLLPFLELKAHSIRQGGLTYYESSVWSMAWRDVIQFFVPDPFGNMMNDQKYWQNQSWLKTIYLGIVPFCLSTFYFLTTGRKRWFFGLLIVISLIFALGGNTPVYRLLYRIPPFNSVRYPVKFLFLFFFVISVTSGLGFDKLRQGIAEGNRRIHGAIQIFFYLGFLFALAWSCTVLFRTRVVNFFDTIGFKPEAYNVIDVNIHDIRRFCFFAFLFCILLLVYRRVTRKRLVMVFMVAILALDLFLANYGFYYSLQWELYTHPHEFVSEIVKEGKIDRYFLTPKTQNTYNRFPKDRAAMGSAYAPLAGLYTAEGAEVLRLGYYELFINWLKILSSIDEAKRFFDVAGIRYVVSIMKLDEDDFSLLKSMKLGDTRLYLYEYDDYPGRFLLFSRIRTVPDEKSMIEAMADRSIDLRQELIVLSKEAQPSAPVSTRGKVELVRYEPNNLVLKCRTDRGGFLYVSDAYYPGWRAYVDGQRTEILRADLAFRAVKVPPGEHTVLFRYVPISFYAGLVVTAIGLILSCLLIVKGRK